jgi:thioesterase domain-containing protein
MFRQMFIVSLKFLNMNLNSIQDTIIQEIPIVEKMGVKLIEFHDYACKVSVPLEPNHNHKNTAFGGSLYSACTAACYGLMYALQVKEKFHDYDLVIGDGSIRYIRPVDNDFFIKAELLPEDWKIFMEKVQKNGFGKIPVKAYVFISSESQQLCSYSATFVMKKNVTGELITNEQ